MSNNKALPAVIVDSALYFSSVKVRMYLQHIAGHATLVLVDSDNDLEPLPSVTGVQFDVLIRNTGLQDNLTFKVNAFNAVTELSNLVPVVAFDSDVEVREFYSDAGVLVVSEDASF